jgi:histidine ammonia-lyase
MTVSATIGTEPLTSERLVAIATDPSRPLTLDDAAMGRVRRGHDAVRHLVQTNTPAYGVTTGVGSQKEHAVDPERLVDYNQRLVRGHATRVPSAAVHPDVVRATLIVMAQQFASGSAGVSPALVELVCAAVRSEELPTIDAAGTVGASDLVPLSQIAEWLLRTANVDGVPGPKEALALINSNAISLATGAFRIVELRGVLDRFDLAAGLTMEGFRGNLDAISEPVNAVHARGGQSDSAARLRMLLRGSRLFEDGEARNLQDPLSFRNVTQIHGAAREFAGWLADVWDTELNSVNVNPLVDVGPKPVYSHGNMDTTRMTLALDGCRQALAKVADVSGERIHKIQWPSFSGLPIGLAREGDAAGGVQFLNLGHIAASLITSTKIWAQPHLLHSVGQLADGVEDTASHALHAVHDLDRQLEAARTIAAIEMVVAVWAIDRRALPIDHLGVGVRPAVEAIRPLLPIGREGWDVFDLQPVLDTIDRLPGSDHVLEATA